MNNDHHTKASGDLGVFKAMVDLHEKGFIVADPLTEHAPFDLITWKDQEYNLVSLSPFG